MSIIIPLYRSLLPSDQAILRHFLYLALFVEPGQKAFPLKILDEPAIAKYYTNWGGMKNDLGLAAEWNGTIIGIAWVRQFDASRPGYGFLDNHTPELNIALEENMRGLGIGGQLIEGLVTQLKKNGNSRVSLSVTKTNPAVRLYLRKGFKIVSEGGNAYTMLLNLQES